MRGGAGDAIGSEGSTPDDIRGRHSRKLYARLLIPTGDANLRIAAARSTSNAYPARHSTLPNTRCARSALC